MGCVFGVGLVLVDVVVFGCGVWLWIWVLVEWIGCLVGVGGFGLW